MPKARGQSSILQSENGDCTRSIQPRLIIRSEILLIEGMKEVDEAIKNKQLSRDAFAKLVPSGQVRSAFLFSTTVLDRLETSCLPLRTQHC
jgi:hypothetical protein